MNWGFCHGLVRVNKSSSGDDLWWLPETYAMARMLLHQKSTTTISVVITCGLFEVYSSIHDTVDIAGIWGDGYWYSPNSTVWRGIPEAGRIET